MLSSSVGHVASTDSDGITILIKSFAQWAFGRPALYAIPSAMPWLGLGETHYRDPLPVTQMELAGQAARIAGQTFAWAEPLLCVAAAHLTMALLLGLVVNRLSRRALRKVEASR